jgi:hypothetical protein
MRPMLIRGIMNENRPIYRSEAVARYVVARQEAILPRMVRPRTQGYLWAGLAFLLALTLVAWWTEVPSYQAGLGTVVVPADPTLALNVVAFFPAEAQPTLNLGEALVVTMPSGERVLLRIREVSTTPMSPAEVRTRYSEMAHSDTIRVPVVVVTAVLDAAALSAPSNLWAGSILPVEAKTGTYRLLSVIPVIGSWFQ